MSNYFRAQTKNIPFADMLNYVSADGGDGMSENGGLCACLTVTELLNNTVMDALDSDDEVVIFAGHEICEIYDGYRVTPIREIARFTISEFVANQNSITEYETL